MNVGEGRPGPALAVMSGPLAVYEPAVQMTMTQAGYTPSSVLTFCAVNPDVWSQRVNARRPYP